MNEILAREDICRIGKSLFERGYVHATAGNISLRLDDGFLITPTDACLGFLDPAQLSKLDQQGQLLSGPKASKTFALHRAIYAATSAASEAAACVVHTHSTHCVAHSIAMDATGGEAELLPPITPYFVMKVGHVPLLPYHRPGDPALADLVSQTIARYAAAGKPIRAVMLQRLGPNVWHQSAAAAMATLEELEETARLCLLSKRRPMSLRPAQIEELRQNFGARW